MDFWDQPYYKMTKTLLRTIGQWPYQPIGELIFFRSMTFIFIAFRFVPQCIAIRHYYNNLEIVMESSGIFIVDFLSMLNIVTIALNFDKVKELLEEIKESWNIFQDDGDRQILHEYSKYGGQLGILYAVGVYIASMVFGSEPLELRISRTFLKQNQSYSLSSIPVEYPGIDIERNYYSLLFVSEVAIFFIASGVIACDLLLFIYTFHASALFAVLGYASENLDIEKKDKIQSNDSEFRHYRMCIQIHNRSIKFTESLAEIFVWNLLGILGANVLLMSLTALQVVINKNSMVKFVKNILFMNAQIIRLFITSLLTQQITDLSLGLQEKLGNSEWYRYPLKAQKLMQLMIMRSQIPCQLTAGKMIVMSMETFSMITRASASYFMVFLAMQ